MLRGVAADGARPDAPPSRLKALPWGETKTRDGLLVVNEQSGEIIRQRMSAQRRDRVRIDREHATAFLPALKRKPEDILGYGDVEVVKGEGIFLTNIEWTAAGKAAWTSLPDISPAFNSRKKDHVVTNLESVALCCDGEIEGLTLCSADAGDGDGTYLQPTKELMNDLIIELLKKAGIEVPEGADDATLRDLALKHLEGGGEVKTEASKETKDEEKPELMSAVLKRLDKMEAAEVSRTASATAAEIEEIKREASAAGKVIPYSDEEIKTLSITPPQLRACVAKLPAGAVPLEGRSGKAAGEAQKSGEKQVTLTAADKQMCELYGLSEEDFKKHAAA